MPENPALEEFKRQIDALRQHPLLAPHISVGWVDFSALSRSSVSTLIAEDAAYYFLIAAAGLNRTALKRAMEDDDARIVPKRDRKAFAIQQRLPIRNQFDDIAASAVALRKGDLARRSRGAIEQLFRDRLAAEGIPILMSPPVRHVPGILIGKRKPDGVYPDPCTRAPMVYFEIKNVRRVADDIQKRLYEIAEASIEMKLLYGNLSLRGFNFCDPRQVVTMSAEIRATMRERILGSPPAVVALFLCPREQAERYREGAEAFVDRIFFQEEVDECLLFLKTKAVEGDPNTQCIE